MERRRFIATAGAAATAGLVGCLDAGADDDFDVGMTASAFTPEEITVDRGGTVVWKNTSSRAHTVTAYENLIPEGAAFFASGGFESEDEAREAWWDGRGGAIENGEYFQHAFEVPGTYEYVCIPHEQGGMVGTVYVEE